MRGAAAAKTAEATTERGAHGRPCRYAPAVTPRPVPLRPGRYAPAVTPRPVLLRAGPCWYATARRAASREVERRPATHASARYGAPRPHRYGMSSIREVELVRAERIAWHPTSSKFRQKPQRRLRGCARLAPVPHAVPLCPESASVASRQSPERYS